MTKNHGVLVGICIVCLLLGFFVGKKTSSDSELTDVATIERNQRKASSRHRENRRSQGDDSELLSRVLDGREIQDVGLQELTDIVYSLSKSKQHLDPFTRARQNYQLHLFLQKLSPSQLEDIVSTIKNDPIEKPGIGLNVVLSSLTLKDRDRALAWVAEQDEPSPLLATVIANIANNDPSAAARMLSEGIVDGSLNTRSLWGTTSSTSRAIAESGSGPLMQFLATLPKRQQESALYSGFDSLPENEKLETLDLVYQKSKDGEMSSNSFNYTFSKMANSDIAKAEAWLDQLPTDKEKADLMAKTATSLFRNGSIEKGLEWMGTALAESPGQEKEILVRQIRSLSYNNPEAIAQFASLLPEGSEFTAKDLESTAQSAFYSGGKGIGSVADAINDPDEKAKLIATSISKLTENKSFQTRMNSTDLEILSRRVDAMGFTGENAEKVQAALNEARNQQN